MTSGVLVTVVDDDESIRDSTKSLLRSAGYQVATFASGELFLESGALLQTRCLVLDIRMPGMTGLELQHRLNLANAGVPTIFITAHFDAAHRQRALDGGAIEVLQKPFSPDALLGAIEVAIKARGDLIGEGASAG